ncbi:zeta toxin family protein [Streptomyces sp. 5.8]|uniref:zeta toxin family protein n=1 Tax=Streptomyces sp. 5.8 TaxID=3406571 RepID=UPI003BB69268
MVVAGPAGAGKSRLYDLLLAVLARRGGAVLIGRDLYQKAHPQYDALMHEDGLTTGVRVRPDVLRWQAEVETHMRRNRFDAVLEAAIADLAEAIETTRTWRTDGYRVEMVAVATSEAEAQLSGLDRYLTQVDDDTGAPEALTAEWGRNLEDHFVGSS